MTSVFFISSSYSIRKQNPNPCSILQCHLLKVWSLVPRGVREGGVGWVVVVVVWGGTRAEARRPLHL